MCGTKNRILPSPKECAIIHFKVLGCKFRYATNQPFPFLKVLNQEVFLGSPSLPVYLITNDLYKLWTSMVLQLQS